jgi:hypothetical protein
MARTNLAAARDKIYTHQGAVAQRINPEQQLRRLVLAHLLWEDQFYVEGHESAELLRDAIKNVSAEKVAEIAIEAREKQKLRHVPLFICREMAALSTHRSVVAETLARVIQRPDELAEYMSLYDPNYLKRGSGERQPLSAQSKRGLAQAFGKFDAYQLAKYNRDNGVKLRDVLFLSHAKPKDAAQAVIWKQLIDGTLPIPDTWEVALSGGADKKTAFERLIAENKLGALALLRNLRNMINAGVTKATIKDALMASNLSRVLPFRFVAAARAVPQLESEIEQAMFRALENYPQIKGKTVLVIDVSGSMFSAGNISKKSDMSRVDAACALAALAREICEDVSVYATAGNDHARVHATSIVPPRRGFALIDAIQKDMWEKLGGGGIFLVQCLDYIFAKEMTADRLIVFTDEVDCDTKLTPATANAFGKQNYLINVASYQNGIGYGKFTHIDGWSEAVLDFIRESEE